MQKNILLLSEIEKEHLPEVGHSQYLLSQALSQNIPVLQSFIINSNVCKTVLRHNKIPEQINRFLSSNLSSDLEYKHLAQKQIHKKIDVLEFPPEILNEIFSAYFNLETGGRKNRFLKKLRQIYKKDSAVTVQSSISHQINNIIGESNLIFAIREIWKLYLTDECFNDPKNFDQILKLFPSITVSESLPSLDKITVEDKLIKNTSSQELTDEQIDQIQKYSTKLNKHLYFPHTYEFILKNKKPRLTKITPYTPKIQDKPEPTRIFFHSPPTQKQIGRQWQEILSGNFLSRGAKIGHVKIINRVGDIHRVHQGDILVTNNLSMKFFPAIQRSGAIVLEGSKKHDYFHNLMLKKGIPMINNVSNATRLLHENQLVMMSGKEGKIYTSSSSFWPFTLEGQSRIAKGIY